MEDDEGICNVCKERKFDLGHNSTVNHRFCSEKLKYNDNRKNLISNRHGVEFDVQVQTINSHILNFQHKSGKYITKVTPEQLQLHNNAIIFDCVVRCVKQDGILLTSVALLHSSRYFYTVFSTRIGADADEPTIVKLLKDGSFKFKVIFKTNLLTCASYKIPLALNFEEVDTKNSGKRNRFTIARAFLIYVDDADERKEEKTKSPFTSQPWKGIQLTHPATKDSIFVDRYPIPGKYKKLLAHCLEPFDSMTTEQAENLRQLRAWIQNLTKENYSRFWHVVLWLEEMSQALMLMKYNMQEVTMEIKDEKNLILEVPGLAEKRPSVIVGDSIRIRLTDDHTVYTGFVDRVNDKTIEILHVNKELVEYVINDPGTPLDVSFLQGRLSYERAHAAVDALVQTRMVNNLFPPNQLLSGTHTTHQLQDSQFINEKVCNNSEQRNAVDKILNSVNPFPYIVYGPPGTGKTVTIVEAMLQIKKRTKKRILVCAPANAACDMLASKLMIHCRTDELIRIHSTTRDRTTIPEDLKDYSNIDDDEFTKIFPDKLATYRIVVTTLVLIGKYSAHYKPDCVFVDEAAQASEPETDIAVALVTTGKQVVLAGDPKQLGPMTTNAAAKFGLATSLLERLMNCDVYKPNPRTKRFDSNFITMLRLNFRSHPDILSIPNKLFYDDLLKAKSLEAQRDPIVNMAVYPVINKTKKPPGHATEFCSVSSKERREGTSPSYFNLFESKMVVKYVRALKSLNLPHGYKVREDQIGVVTPYQRQVFKIKEGLKYNGYPGVEVGTTETFQGREKRIIIISTVRAQHSLLLHDRKYNLGFVQHDQRFNVALTRAISKLIVIGNPLVLRTDSKWLEYMEMCEEKGTYFGNHFPKIDSVFRKDVVHRMREFKDKDDQYHHH